MFSKGKVNTPLGTTEEMLWEKWGRVITVARSSLLFGRLMGTANPFLALL